MISPGSLEHETGSARRDAPAAHPVANARRQQAPDEVALDVVPFGALLASFTNPAGANRARGGAASSFGVFESGNASGHEQKQAALRQGQASRRADAQARYDVDRTGVDARRSNQAEPRGVDALRTTQTTAADQNQSQSLMREARSTRLASLDVSTGGPARVSDRSGDLVRRGNPTGMPSPIDSDAGNAARGPSAEVSSPQVAQVSGSAAVTPPAPSGSASSDVAQEVGRSLGASRVGDVETARAPTGTAHAALGRTGRQGAPGSGRLPTELHSEKTESPLQARSTKESEPTPFDRLIRSIRMQAGAHRSQARMMLDPPELGRVLVDVAMVGDTIEVSVRAETLQARELLQDRVAKLRQALRKQGIEVERFTVDSDWPGKATVAAPDGNGPGHQDVPEPGLQPRRLPRRQSEGRDAATTAGTQSEEPSKSMRGPVAERRIDVRI